MTGSEPPLLHICHAPADHGWVRGRMLPALGLVEHQVRTRADDAPGELQLAEIERMVDECRITVLIASSAARWDRMTQLAARLAQHATAEHDAPRLVVIARDFAPGSDAERRQLTLGQRALVGLDCSDDARTDEALARLRRLLELDEPTAETPGCPYPGLERFTAANRHLLFGRDQDRDAVLHRIRSGHTRLLVLGPSGSGKSSLIHAAVLPALGDDRHLVRIVPRGGELAAALRATIDSLEVPGAGAAIDRFLADPGGDAELAALAVPDPRRRVVVIDPLEEVFADDDPAARARLFQLATGLWRLPWCTVILCMRADFYGALMAERCWRELEHHQYAVTPLDDHGLRAAIVEPARYAGVHVEAALVERLIRETDRDRSAVPLPLLQVALKELWARLSWRYLTLESYERVVSRDQRGLAAALAVHADAVLQALTAPGDRELAQRILLDLVHLGEGRPHTRRRRTRDELRRSGDAPGQLERVLDRLIDGRLVVTSSGDAAPPCAEPHVDLAHDVLISGWCALAAWVQDRQADMVKHRRLERWAREWLDGGRASGLLDDGSTAEARAWRDSLGGRALGVSEALVELICASEAANARARRDKEAMIARLVEEQRKTRKSIAAATHVAQEIVFRIDRSLRTVAGASRARERLLTWSRTLLRDLEALGGVDSNAQRTDMFAKVAQGDVARERGRLDDAYRLFDEVHTHARRQADADPDNAEWQRDLSLSYNKLGEVAVAAGKLDEARAWFAWGLAVRKGLADADPANARRQHDLSVSYERLGDVAVATGELDDARNWFELSLEVSKTLAEADPSRIEWQHDLSVSYSRLGDVAVAAGKLDDARAWFERSFSLTRLLAEADPVNAGRQHDLSVAYYKLGNAAIAAGKLDDARAWFEHSLALLRLLTEADPDNAGWQYDLSVSYDKRGDVEAIAGKPDQARAWFDRSLAVRKPLADSDPGNASWQRGLAASYDKLGTLASDTGNLDGARAWFERDLAISKALARTDPSNPGWQRDLATSYDKLGGVAAAAGKLAEAGAWFRDSLEVRQALIETDPSNASWRRDVATSYDELGDNAVAAGQLDDARAWFKHGLILRTALAEAEPGSLARQREVAVSCARLGNVAVTAGRLDDARAWFERELTATEALADADGGAGNAALQHDLADARARLGRVELAAGRFRDARAWFERSLAASRPLVEASPGNARWQRALSRTYRELGDVAIALGELRDARARFERSLAVHQTLTGGTAADRRCRPELSRTYRKLGNIAVALGEPGDARAWFERRLALSRTLAEADPTSAELQRDLLISHLDLARIAAIDPAVARRHTEHAAVIFDRIRGAGALAGDPELAAFGALVAR